MRGREITDLERQKLELYLKGHWSLRDIGKLFGRNHGVLSRELTRNRKPDGTYSAVYAQQLCDKRRVRRGNVRRKLDRNDRLCEWVVKHLKEGFAPDVIAGRLRLAGSPELHGLTISHESIYQWLYEGEGHMRALWNHLPSAQPKRQHRGTRTKQTKSTIPGRVSIHTREEGINQRLTRGHWETDSVVYNKGVKQRLSVQTERKARYVLLHRLPSGTAQDTLDAIRESIASVPQDYWKSITFDNGSEGALHQNLSQDYGVQTFFCDPYSSWQKGTVENMNGLIRRHLHKIP